MTPAELEAIEKRAEAASEGPWSFIKVGDGVWLVEHISGNIRCFHDLDAEFIAAARSDVPALVAEVRRLRELVKAVETHGIPELAWAGPMPSNCPWCRYMVAEDFKRKHAPECPAFHPDGSVR